MHRFSVQSFNLSFLHRFHTFRFCKQLVFILIPRVYTLHEYTFYSCGPTFHWTPRYVYRWFGRSPFKFKGQYLHFRFAIDHLEAEQWPSTGGGRGWEKLTAFIHYAFGRVSIRRLRYWGRRTKVKGKLHWPDKINMNRCGIGVDGNKLYFTIGRWGFFSNFLREWKYVAMELVFVTARRFHFIKNIINDMPSNISVFK